MLELNPTRPANLAGNLSLRNIQVSSILSFVYLTFPRFRDRAQHISHILRDQPVLPAEKAAYWIAHVAKYGGGYLRPRAADLTWIELNLVDVYAFLGAILLGVLGVIYIGCKVCLWLVRGSNRPEKLKIN